MGSAIYIGSFPPPYGGVTVKNGLLFQALSQRLQIKKIDLMKAKQGNPFVIFALVRCLLFDGDPLVIGTSASWRRRLTNILYLLNKKRLAKSTLIYMGGVLPSSNRLIMRFGKYRKVYVETESMVEQLRSHGLDNVSKYPNCRVRPAESLLVPSSRSGHIEAVFFSQISKEKGADIVLSAAGKLPQVTFNFYGPVVSEFRSSFDAALSSLENVHYHGVFNSAQDDVINELRQYDLHLFLTQCDTEGVPGVIAETKIAGVPTIASSLSHNRELISDYVDGRILDDCSPEELAAVIGELDDDRSSLEKMKRAAIRSSEIYFIDQYIDEIVGCLL